MDQRIEDKAQVHHYSHEQENQLKKIRDQLTEAEGRLREANEKELPEEDFRVQVEDKRQKLQSLLDEFDKINLKTLPEHNGLSPRSYARKERYPKVTNDIMEQQQPHRRDDSDLFANFGNRQHQRRAASHRSSTATAEGGS